MFLPCPWKGADFTVSFAAGRRLRLEVYFASADEAGNLAALDELAKHRRTLEAVCTDLLEFDEMPGRKAARIARYRDDSDVTDTARHDEFVDWFFTALGQMRQGLDDLPPGR